MPRYDYRCVECSNEFELVQSFSEAGTGICPVCSGRGQRVFHAVPVIYKGSGFYTTDYGRPKRPVENGSKDTSDKKATASESSSNDKESKSSASEKSTDSSDSKSESTAKASSGAGSSTEAGSSST